MKFKLVLFLTVLALALSLCACGNAQQEPTVPEATAAPTEAAEPTDPGLFVTEDVDDMFTMPEEFQGLTLPEDVFEEDVTGVFSTVPVEETTDEETDPEATEEPTEAPIPTSFDPDILPEHVFDE